MDSLQTAAARASHFFPPRRIQAFLLRNLEDFARPGGELRLLDGTAPKQAPWKFGACVSGGSPSPVDERLPVARKTRGPTDNTMKLYVGNLPFSASEDDIRGLFEDFGGVADLHIPMDRETGRPRGFAFVTLNTREQGEAAIGGLDGKDMDGRALRISEAQERAPRAGGGGGGGGGGGDRRGGGGGGYGGDRRGGGGGGDRRGGGGGGHRDRRGRGKREDFGGGY